MIPLFPLLFACQEPFAVDRHDLAGDRVAAIEVNVNGEEVRPRLAMIADGRPYVDVRPALGWAWVEVGDDEAVLDAPFGEAGEGPAPTLPLGSDRRLVLIVDWASGEQRHFVDLLEPLVPSPLGAIEVEEVSLPPDTDLSVDARMGWPTEASTWIAPDAVGRFTARTPLGVRWMATGGDFLELDNDTADWWPGSLVRDEAAIEEVTPGEVGVETVIALVGNEQGTLPGYTVRDVGVGEPTGGGFTRSSRWMPTVGAPEGRPVVGTLEADDDALGGVRLVIDGAWDGVDPGTAELCAVPHTGPFDPNWLLDGTCARDEVVGATVAVDFR